MQTWTLFVYVKFEIEDFPQQPLKSRQTYGVESLFFMVITRPKNQPQWSCLIPLPIHTITSGINRIVVPHTHTGRGRQCETRGSGSGKEVWCQWSTLKWKRPAEKNKNRMRTLRGGTEIKRKGNWEEQGRDKLDDKCQKLESNQQHLEYMVCLSLLPHRAAQCV